MNENPIPAPRSVVVIGTFLVGVTLAALTSIGFVLFAALAHWSLTNTIPVYGYFGAHFRLAGVLLLTLTVVYCVLLTLQLKKEDEAECTVCGDSHDGIHLSELEAIADELGIDLRDPHHPDCDGTCNDEPDEGYPIPGTLITEYPGWVDCGLGTGCPGHPLEPDDCVGGSNGWDWVREGMAKTEDLTDECQDACCDGDTDCPPGACCCCEPCKGCDGTEEPEEAPIAERTITAKHITTDSVAVETLALGFLRCPRGCPGCKPVGA